jgi:hypothetical protein
MSWAGLASNQCVSRNNLQNAVNTGVFVLKNTIPAGTKQITKDEAYSYVYINPIPSKTSNQLVVKSNLTAASLLPYSYTIFYSIRDGDAIGGFNTSGEACAASTYSNIVYSSSSTIGVGTALYFDAYGTEPVIATTIQYYRIGINYITFETLPPPYESGGNVINSIGTCITLANVDISNGTAGTNITNITINGVQVNGPVFPIVAGDGASATTSQTGASQTIVVSYTNVSNDSVEVIDTASNLTCVSATGTSRTFNGQVVTAGGTVNVFMFDGSC